MTAFGGIFGSPELEGEEGSEESGQRSRIVGLDLDSGVVRLRAPRSTTVAEDPAVPPEE